MIKIEFNQTYMLKRYEYSLSDFSKDIDSLYKATCKILKLNYDFVVGVSFVGQQKIRLLNRQYRNVDRVTDVLSFPLVEDFANFEEEKDECGKIDLGDIVINLKRAEKQAKEYNHSFKREVCFLCLHGLLHLLGYDHIKQEDEKVMFKLQTDILNAVDIRR